MEIGTIVQFEAAAAKGHFLRSDGQRITAQPSKWRVSEPLASVTSASAVTLIPVEAPNFALRHRSKKISTEAIAVIQREAVGPKDSTFTVEPSPVIPGAFILRVVTPGFTDHVMRHQSYDVYVHKDDGSPQLRRDASWLVTVAEAGVETQQAVQKAVVAEHAKARSSLAALENEVSVTKKTLFAAQQREAALLADIAALKQRATTAVTSGSTPVKVDNSQVDALNSEVQRLRDELERRKTQPVFAPDFPEQPSSLPAIDHLKLVSSHKATLMSDFNLPNTSDTAPSDAVTALSDLCRTIASAPSATLLSTVQSVTSALLALPGLSWVVPLQNAFVPAVQPYAHSVDLEQAVLQQQQRWRSIQEQLQNETETFASLKPSVMKDESCKRMVTLARQTLETLEAVRIEYFRLFNQSTIKPNERQSALTDCKERLASHVTAQQQDAKRIETAIATLQTNYQRVLKQHEEGKTAIHAHDAENAQELAELRAQFDMLVQQLQAIVSRAIQLQRNLAESKQQDDAAEQAFGIVSGQYRCMLGEAQQALLCAQVHERACNAAEAAADAISSRLHTIDENANVLLQKVNDAWRNDYMQACDAELKAISSRLQIDQPRLDHILRQIVKATADLANANLRMVESDIDAAEKELERLEGEKVHQEKVIAAWNERSVAVLAARKAVEAEQARFLEASKALDTLLAQPAAGTAGDDPRFAQMMAAIQDLPRTVLLSLKPKLEQMATSVQTNAVSLSTLQMLLVNLTASS